ncbi:MAG: hypothetical protein AAGA12_12310 [Pseudomonadota bacterium]
MQGCNKNKKPTISPFQAASVFKEMRDCRREFCNDDKYFKVIEVWEYLASETPEIKIKSFDSKGEVQSKKAGVVAFGDRFTLIASRELLKRAKNGCWFSNFTLAHELGHIALDHHALGAVVKNFELFASSSGLINDPPTYEELEATFAAVLFQCGVALFDQSWTPVELAKRAYSDPKYIQKAMELCVSPEFKSELARLDQVKKRVVL